MPAHRPCTVTISYVAKDRVPCTKALRARACFCRDDAARAALVASYDPNDPSNVIADDLRPNADGPQPGPEAAYYGFFELALFSACGIVGVLLLFAIDGTVEGLIRRTRRA